MRKKRGATQMTLRSIIKTALFFLLFIAVLVLIVWIIPEKTSDVKYIAPCRQSIDLREKVIDSGSTILDSYPLRCEPYFISAESGKETKLKTGSGSNVQTREFKDDDALRGFVADQLQKCFYKFGEAKRNVIQLSKVQNAMKADYVGIGCALCTEFDFSTYHPSEGQNLISINPYLKANKLQPSSQEQHVYYVDYLPKGDYAVDAKGSNSIMYTIMWFGAPKIPTEQQRHILLSKRILGKLHGYGLTETQSGAYHGLVIGDTAAMQKFCDISISLV